MKRKVQNLSEKTRVLGNQAVKHKQFAEFPESLAAKAVQRFGFVYADKVEEKEEADPKPAPKRKPRAKAEPKLEDRV